MILWKEMCLKKKMMEDKFKCKMKLWNGQHERQKRFNILMSKKKTNK